MGYYCENTPIPSSKKARLESVEMRAISSLCPAVIEDPAELLLLWHIDNASFMSENQNNFIISPPFVTPYRDTWKIFLKPRGLSLGAPAVCQLLFDCGQLRVVSKFRVCVLTPTVLCTRFYNGKPLLIAAGGEIRCDRFHSAIRGGVHPDRVTIEVRIWMGGVPPPPAKMEAVSTLKLNPLVFAASYEGKGKKKQLVLDESKREILEKDVQLEMWTPDGDNCGLIVHLGPLFHGVKTLKGSFILAHRSPIDPNGIIQTHIKKTVMFHRWMQGSVFRVPPFFPKGPVCIVCSFQSFRGEISDGVKELHYEADDQMLQPATLGRRGRVDVAAREEGVKLIIDVEQEKEFRRSRPVIGWLERVDWDWFKDIVPLALLLALGFGLIIASIIYKIEKMYF